MLLLGTQILNWYWLVLLGLAGVALGGWRVWRRAHSPYRVAQELDRRLALHDTLSTAWFLSTNEVLAGSPAGRLQLAQAESLLPGVAPERAFPVRFARAWGLALALASVAFGLFAIRYLVRRDLSLSQGLLPMQFGRFTAAVKARLAAAERSRPAADAEAGQRDENSEAALTEADDPRMDDVIGVKNPVAPSAEDQAGSLGKQADRRANAQSAPLLAPATSQSAAERAKNAGKGAAAEHPPVGAPKAGGNPLASASRSPSAGLMDRVKDAVSSMLAKMRPATAPPPQAGEQTQGSSGNQARGQGEQSDSPKNGTQSSKQSATAESQASQQGKATELSQSAQGKGSHSGDHEGGDRSQSGIGRQDGAKALKEAAELQAMGKLAEIIGKRSRNLSGDVTVEAPSGLPQLRTDYTGLAGRHADTGGVIDRDEVPIIYQQYVRDYMERVRRQAAKGN